MKTRSILIAGAWAVCLLLCVTARAQGESEQRVKMRDLPEAVRRTVEGQSRGARVRGLSKEIEGGKTFYEAELSVNGHTRDVLMDESGAVVEIEEQVALASLPEAARAAIAKQAGKGRVLFVESVTKGGSVAAYEAHVRKGRRTLEIKVAPDGTPVAEDK